MKHSVIKQLAPLLVPIDSLHLDPANARQGHDIDGIAASLVEFGQRTPLVVMADGGRVLKGNGTLKAARALGWTHIAALKVADSDITATRYSIADNYLGDKSHFSLETLGKLLDGLDEPESVPGVDEDWLDEVRALTEGDDGGVDVEDVAPQIDRASELQEVWGTALGQIWKLGEHRLVCGDCTDEAVVAAVMDGEKADMVFTDPPYGMELDTDYSKIKGTDKSPNALGYSYTPVIGDNKLFDFMPFADFPCKEQFWWGADYYAKQVSEKGSWFVWLKRNEPDAEMIGNDFELCWSKQKHKRHAIRIRWVGWAATEHGEKRAHPTQKPVALPEWFFNKYGKVRDCVVDFFLGSGTTLIACERLNRKCRAIEIEPKYVAVTLQRWHDATGKTPELIGNV